VRWGSGQASACAVLCGWRLLQVTKGSQYSGYRYFVGAAWAAGMDISSGMFVPMLLIGAVLGRLVGLVMVDLFHADTTGSWWLQAADDQWKWIDPGVFAVVGAAAFMGGVTRLTVALAAIMMEVRSLRCYQILTLRPQAAMQPLHLTRVSNSCFQVCRRGCAAGLQ
jgi:hypothetical protein